MNNNIILFLVILLLVSTDKVSTYYSIHNLQKNYPGIDYLSAEKTPEGEKALRSDSVTLKIVDIIDRSGEITITSPVTQTFEEALRIEGSIDKLGNEGVKIEVRGPEGRIFGPQYIGTKTDVKDDAGIFTYRVPVMSSGTYEVSFSDPHGFIGIKKFEVAEPPTPEPTTIATTVPVTAARPVTTTIATPPPATMSPLQVPIVLGALTVAGLLGAAAVRRQ